MSFDMILGMIQSVLELGLITSLTVLALFLSYSMLNVCDLSTDGCFTLGAAVGATVAIAGYPYLSIVAAMAAGIASGFLTSFLQTKMGINSLLAGIIVNTGLYSVNMTVMGNKADLNMNFTRTIFTDVKSLLKDTFLNKWSSALTVLVFVAAVIVFLSFFLKTRMGLAIRATGDNAEMVRHSSINPVITTTVGLCVANAFTALSGCLLGQYQKSMSINMGQGIVTVALASLLIGGVMFKRGKIPLRAVCAVIGAVIFRLVFAIALKFNMPAHMLKLVSSVIVIAAISAPYLRKEIPIIKKRLTHKYGGKRTGGKV